MERRRTGISRTGAASLVVVAGAAAGVLTAVAVPWDGVLGGDVVPARVSDLFTTAQVERAEAFGRSRRLAAWSSLLASLLVSLLLGLTPLGARLARRVAGGARWWLAVLGGTGAVLAVGRLVTLPFSLLLRQQSLEAGLTRQHLGGWLRDVAVSFGLSWATTGLLLVLLVGLARRAPRVWFVPAAGLAAALVAAGSYVYPVVVEPLFNEFSSMPPGPLRSDVLALAARQGVAVDDVLVSDASRRTTTLNAYVSGFGSTRRVVVYDTLVEVLPPAQARAVIAHEIAHARSADVVVGTSLGALGGAAGVGLLALLLDSGRLRARAGVDGPADPRVPALVLALVAVGSLLASPVVSGISRAVETRADRDALVATADPAAFVAMQRRLALRSLSDPTPPAWSQWWFGTHPTVLERAGLAASLDAGRREQP